MGIDIRYFLLLIIGIKLPRMTCTCDHCLEIKKQMDRAAKDKKQLIKSNFVYRLCINQT